MQQYKKNSLAASTTPFYNRHEFALPGAKLDKKEERRKETIKKITAS